MMPNVWRVDAFVAHGAEVCPFVAEVEDVGELLTGLQTAEIGGLAVEQPPGSSYLHCGSRLTAWCPRPHASARVNVWMWEWSQRGRTLHRWRRPGHQRCARGQRKDPPGRGQSVSPRPRSDPPGSTARLVIATTSISAATLTTRLRVLRVPATEVMAGDGISVTKPIGIPVAESGDRGIGGRDPRAALPSRG